jgi:uncharacterized repeat protein (TIGR03806 family)
LKRALRWVLPALGLWACAGQVAPAPVPSAVDAAQPAPAPDGQVSAPDGQVPDIGMPWDAGVDSGLGPLMPRVENTTCVLPDPPRIGTMTVVDAFEGLSTVRPLWFGTAPGQPSLRFVVEQAGRVAVFPADAPDQVQSFLDLRVSRAGNEEGLLGLAFHPHYARNQRFYLYYSAANPRRSVISEFQVDPANPLRALPDSERILLEVNQPFSNHNGGDLQFGPDGFLYISLGDGGAAGDPRGHGQRPDTLLGAVLRIDVDRADPVCGTPYGIPEGNPFAEGRCAATPGEGRPEVWAWGLRNTWRMSFDPASGLLWGADVGQDEIEEINVLRKGRNYGWKPVEGDRCYVEGCELAAFEAPVYAYGHAFGESVTGGVVYRGVALPELWGAYIFGDYTSGRLWALRPGAPGQPPQVTVLADTGLRLTAFGTDPQGELFLVAFNSRTGISRLQRQANAPPVTPVPRLLSATGCYTDTASKRMAPGVLPFEPRAPFWSDNAHKLRFLALPPGGKMGWRAEDSLELPVGTILLKEFDMARPDGTLKRFESRLLHKSTVGWIGYSYRWNAEGTDAVLLDGAVRAPIEGPQGVQQWDFPSRIECMACHTPEARYALGITSRQLNWRWTYPNGVQFNQLSALAQAGYIDLPGAPESLPTLVDPADETQPLEQRVRAYLDTNCAGCHLPEGAANATLDLRATTPLAEMGLCNVEPAQGDLGIEGARLLVPGDPGRSILLQRAARRGEDQMPPLGSNSLDLKGVLLLEAWISGMAACP